MKVFFVGYLKVIGWDFGLQILTQGRKSSLLFLIRRNYIYTYIYDSIEV
jgi:hypothetical protein